MALEIVVEELHLGELTWQNATFSSSLVAGLVAANLFCLHKGFGSSNELVAGVLICMCPA